MTVEGTEIFGRQINNINFDFFSVIVLRIVTEGKTNNFLLNNFFRNLGLWVEFKKLKKKQNTIFSLGT